MWWLREWLAEEIRQFPAQRNRGCHRCDTIFDTGLACCVGESHCMHIDLSCKSAVIGETMQKLLYHAPRNPNQESPFDRAIVQVVKGQKASIVSPYIGLQYLERIVGLSTSWRLISDVLEWLSATPVKERSAVYEFLRAHHGLVHHYPAIHAKAVVSDAGAYTGSANLTDAGVLRRTEFGVLLTDPVQVEEIQQWFDAIWSQTSPPPLHRVGELISELDQISAMTVEFADFQATRLESGARRVRAKLVKILGHEPLSVASRLKGRAGDAAPVDSPTITPAHGLQRQIVILPRPALPARPPEDVTFDLEAELDAFVEKNALGSFSFSEVHDAMRRRSPALTFADTYAAILEFCASHPRSLFSSDAVNRLVYRNGRFVQSSKDLLIEAVKPMDQLVCSIIEMLSFEEPRQWFKNAKVQGVPPSVHGLVLQGMTKAGYVSRTDSGLTLVSSTPWSPRLKLLERAHSMWTSRLNRRSLKQAPVPEVTVLALTSAPAATLISPTPPQAGPLSPADAALEHQTVAIQRRNAQLDAVFSHLAELLRIGSDKAFVSLTALKADLVRKSGLGDDDVTRLITGTFRMFRSPFLAMVTSSTGQVRIFADLQNNPHLKDLQKTREMVENSPALRALLSPSRPQQIDLSAPSNRKAMRVRLNSPRAADEAYLLITKWIFRTLPAPLPMAEEQLMSTLTASGVEREDLHRLLLDHSSKLPRLFALLRKGNYSRLVSVQPGNKIPFSISLLHKNLDQYPSTHAYLKTVVWASGTSHDWLPDPKQMREEAIRAFEKSAIKTLVRESSSRDKVYLKLLDFISKRMLHPTRFKTSDALVTALLGSRIEKFIVSFLLGIEHSPPGQLMAVQIDADGIFVQLRAGELKTYPRSQAFLKNLGSGGASVHPWLTPVEIPLAAPASPATATQVVGKPALTPLRQTNSEHDEIDALYAALAQIFVEHQGAIMHVAESSGALRESAVASYLKVCESRKMSASKIEPILSLHIHDSPDNHLELVIYRNYHEHLRHFPRLQRTLVQSRLKMREV